MMKSLMKIAVMVVALTMPLYAQEGTDKPLKVTGHGKTAFMATESQRARIYDGQFHFSPAVRAGDTVYMSGVVAGAYTGDKPVGRAEFKASVRSAFEGLVATLKADGVDINQTVKIQTFHVFDSPWISIGKVEQIEVIAEVKGEFIGEPYPAWTAIGATALFPDKGLVEIELTLYDPKK